MDLKLEERLSPEELTELRKRAYSFADQMFMEGISIGRALGREDYYSTTETFVKDKISAMTSYFVRDDIWVAQPPVGYNPDPNVSLPEPSHQARSRFVHSVSFAEDMAAEDDPLGFDSDGYNTDGKLSQENPELTDKVRPFG